jgi:ABC-2 type transport system permease protein
MREMIRRFIRKIFGQERLRQVDLITRLVRRELAVKYRGSVLGYLWSMVNPLLFMAIISVVFSFVVRDIPYYHLYVLSGILFWNLTSNSILGGTHAIVNGASLLRKVRMPVWVFPIVPLLTFSINFLLALIPYFLVFVITGPKVSPNVWQLPIVLCLFIVFLSGVSLVLSSLNVFFRDVGHVIEPLLVMAMYGTPVIYDRHKAGFPARVSNILGYNPVTHFVEAGRSCLFTSEALNWSQWMILFALATISISLGLFIYKRLKDKFIFNL